MTQEKISFDLHLSNRIFKANVKSLLELSIGSIARQNEEHGEFLEKLRDEAPTDWREKSAHYANIEWLLLNSMFLSVFSIFEHHLFTLTRVVEKNTKSKVEIQDLSGKGVVKYCSYLFLVGHIGSADRSKPKWQELFNYQKVRNLIAHNGGLMITDLSKKLESHECFKFLKSRDVIMAGPVGHIRIRSHDFIKGFIEHTSNLSDELTTEIAAAFQIDENGR
jgi:hypothetical protein